VIEPCGLGFFGGQGAGNGGTGNHIESCPGLRGSGSEIDVPLKGDAPEDIPAGRNPPVDPDGGILRRIFLTDQDVALSRTERRECAAGGKVLTNSLISTVGAGKSTRATIELGLTPPGYTHLTMTASLLVPVEGGRVVVKVQRGKAEERGGSGVEQEYETILPGPGQTVTMRVNDGDFLRITITAEGPQSVCLGGPSFIR
jgi:hypothetical protein